MDNEEARKLSEVIQEHDQIGGVLVGWVLVSEWMDLEGRRWLSRVHANADGSTLPEWQLNGYLHNALHTEWEHSAEDLEDDEPE